MTRYYPISLDLTGRICLVVGGGSVGERKVEGLLEAEASVRVVSPDLSSRLQSLAESGAIQASKASYAPSFLEGVSLVFAATDHREINAQVVADATARGIPVNAADSPEESSFLTPSVLRRGDLCISIATGGNSPMLAARLHQEFEARFAPEYADYLELLGRMRRRIQSLTSDASLRRKALSGLLDAENELLSRLKQGESEEAESFADALIRTVLTGDNNG